MIWRWRWKHAATMEERGRTQMKPLRYQTRDYAAYGVLMAYLVQYRPSRVWTLTLTKTEEKNAQN